MTMSGDHNEAFAPLDLRTTTRDITDQTTGQTKTREIADRTPNTEDVVCSSRGCASIALAIKPDSKECTDSHDQAVPAKLKCERLNDSDGKSQETVSKLPIRKRPVRTDHKHMDESDKTLREPPKKVVKTESSPSPAKAPKFNRVRNGLQAETQQVVPCPVPGGAQSDTSLTPATCESQLLFLVACLMHL